MKHSLICHARRLLLAAAATLACAAVQAAGYPSHAITWVVPYPPGGTTDVVARFIAQAMSKAMDNVSIVVENKPGAGGQIGMTYVARAAPDGYTLLVSDASLATAPSLYKTMQFDPQKDLQAVSLFVTVPHVLVVTPKLEVKNLAELIALAAREPGKINFSSGGLGSPLHLAGEAVRRETGLTWTHVPYKGGGPAILAVITGEAQVATPSLPSALAQIQGGKLHALAVTSDKRVKALPDVPTVAELGYPKATLFGWVGLHAPAGTPPEVMKTLQAAAARAMQDPELAKRLLDQAADVRYEDGRAYAALVQNETARWSAVVKAAGITPE
jgi:tripartite-type tricarboxylate transporter receptor subunit TctC